jgi:hypothetical protein
MLLDVQSERYFDEQIVEVFAGELQEIRLGLCNGELVIELSGPRDRMRWILAAEGSLQKWIEDEKLSMKVAVPPGLLCPEVLEPVVINEEIELVSVVEITRNRRSLYIEGHWENGMWKQVRVTHNNQILETLTIADYQKLAGKSRLRLLK